MTVVTPAESSHQAPDSVESSDTAPQTTGDLSERPSSPTGNFEVSANTPVGGVTAADVPADGRPSFQSEGEGALDAIESATPPSPPEGGAAPAPGADGRDSPEEESDGPDDAGDADAAWREQKRRELLTLLSAEPPDVAAVRELARSAGGLLEDELRRRAWPLLLRPDGRLSAAPEVDDAELRAHPYHHQVVLDVERTLKRFPPGIDDCVRLGLQGSLIRLILRSLAAHPELHYYQGYHDVAITVLLVCGENVAPPVLCELADTHLRVFMAPTMEETRDLLTYVLPLLEAADPPVCEFLVRSEAMATFALPWVITWFSHVLPHYHLITRLFDFVLASGWLSPVYLSAALVLHRRDELLAADCDLAAAHGLLAAIPAELPWERLLERAARLMDELPAARLRPRVDALNRARRRAEREELERLRQRRLALERRRRLQLWLPSQHWTVIGVTLGVALLAGTVHYWRSRVD